MNRMLLFGCCLLAGCDHAWPYDSSRPGPLGPQSQVVPRRLTFSTGDDRDPSVRGNVLVYSRLDPDERGNERCVAGLPLDGGTILYESCPGPPRTLADTFVDTWIEPALSQDGNRVAYMWQQGSLVSVLGFGTTRVVVAPADRAGDTTGFVWPIFYIAPDGRPADAVTQLSWVDDRTVRFIIGHEYVFKVKGGGLERYTDTTFQAYGLADLDIETGTLHVSLPGDSAFQYTPAPDGGLWLVRLGAPRRVWHLAPPPGADTATIVGDFSGAVVWLTSVGGMPAAIVGDTLVQWLVPGDSVPRQMVVGGGGGPVHRIVGIPGSRRFIAEIERGWDLFGDRANLWLYELP